VPRRAWTCAVRASSAPKIEISSTAPVVEEARYLLAAARTFAIESANENDDNRYTLPDLAADADGTRASYLAALHREPGL
jgi:hypothetical protein